MKVKAIKRGFFGGVYRIPDTESAEFDCPSDRQFSKRWMEKVKRGKKAQVDPPKVNAYVPLETPTLIREEFEQAQAPE